LEFNLLKDEIRRETLTKKLVSSIGDVRLTQCSDILNLDNCFLNNFQSEEGSVFCTLAGNNT